MMRQTILKAFLLCVGLACSLSFQSVIAADKTIAKKSTVTTKARVNQKTAVAAQRGTNETDAQLSQEGYTMTIYQCDLGDKISIYKKTSQPDSLKMRWKNKVYVLSRVHTSTGANRFENKSEGFVLVSIPSKLMLFDSIKGRQLANECRNPEQAKAFYNKTHIKK